MIMVQSRKEKAYKFRYNKLVRDRIPEIIKREGWLIQKKVLGAAAFRRELFKKLTEEVGELAEAETKKEVASELADLQEIISSLAACYGLKLSELEVIKRQKKRRNGGYDKKIFIGHVAYLPGADTAWLEYHLKDPKKFPLIK